MHKRLYLRNSTPALVNNKVYDPDPIGDTDVKLNRLEEVHGIMGRKKRCHLQAFAIANMLRSPTRKNNEAVV